MKNNGLLLGILAAAAQLSGCAPVLAETLSTPLAQPGAPPWSSIQRPAAFPGTKTEVFGSYSNGCISGAVAIPESGPGWEAIHPSRNRLWGHPEMLTFLQELGSRAQAHEHGKFIVGDVSQPCGMPMVGGGHASHQIGLDVDIFFGFAPHPLSREERENFTNHNVAVHKLEVLDGEKFRLQSELTAEWNESFAEAMREAAELPAVERIFISPPVKKALCEKFRSADGKHPAWLKKIRPYYEHQEHFHVRLACPKEDHGCEVQKPIDLDPADTTQVGCAGMDLEKWFETDPAKSGFLKDAIEKYKKEKITPAPPVDWKAKEENLPAKCKELIKLASPLAE